MKKLFRRRLDDLPPGLQYEDLPAWMRPARRGIDWAFLVVLLLALVIAWPFVVRPDLPLNVGMQTEIVRTVEMAAGLQSGVLYPRWAADFNFGYGAPLWNYLAPLPHYLAGLHNVLAQSNPLTSVRLVFVFSIGLNGVALFSFVRRRWGTYAGLLGAMAFLFSPQLALVKPYLESDLPGLLAVGWFLAALWAFDRVWARERGIDVALAAGMVALVMLSHTPLNVFLLGMLAAWQAWFGVGAARRQRRYAVAAFVAGLGLSAFYWLPALMEHNEVRWEPYLPFPSEPWQTIDLGALLALPQRMDRHAINPPWTASLGPALWIGVILVVVVVMVATWRRTPRDRRSVSRGEAFQWRLVQMSRRLWADERDLLFFAVAGVVTLVLVLPLARPLWDALPDWPSLCPRDLLLVLTACGALVTARAGRWIEAQRRWWMAVLLMSVCLGGIVVAALRLLPLSPWPESRDTPDVQTVVRSETEGYLIASLLDGWLLPHTVTTTPQPSLALIASYPGGVIDKVARDQLPGSVKVDAVKHEPQAERLVVDAAGSTTLTLLTFDYAGWQVEINELPVTHTPAPETGLITVPLPTGQYEVSIFLGGTFPRDAGWLIAAVALMFILATSARLENRIAPGRPRYVADDPTRQPVAWRMVLLLTATLAVGGGALARLAPELFTRASPPGVVLTAQHQLPRAMSGVDMLAYDLEPGTELQPGDDLAITLYWRAARPDLPDYQVELALLDEQDQVVMIVQRPYPGLLPPSWWTAWPLFDYYVRDAYYVRLDDDLPPGSYRVAIQVGQCTQSNHFPCEAIRPLFVNDGRGMILGQRIVLPETLEVE